MTKPCKECGKRKEVNSDNFKKEKFNLDGFGNLCNECKAAHDKERYEQKKKDKVLYQF